MNVEIRDSASERFSPLINAMPFILLLALWIFMMLRLRNGPRQGPLPGR